MLKIYGMGEIGNNLFELFKHFNYSVKGIDRLDEKNKYFEGENNIIKDVHFICVNTALKSKQVCMTNIKNVTREIISNINFNFKEDIIIFESTLNQNFLEKFMNKLEKEINQEINYGYSPERFDSGNLKHTIHNTSKIVSAKNKNVLDKIIQIYSNFLDPKLLIKANCIEEAVLSKLLENIQRDVNISLLNEYRYVCDKSNVNIHDVLKLSSTKWNFLNYYPGLVGGHCLTTNAHQLDGKYKVIHNARIINDSMVEYHYNKIIKQFAVNDKIIFIGLGFKSNSSIEEFSLNKILYQKLKLHFKNIKTENIPFSFSEDDKIIDCTMNNILINDPKIKTENIYII